MVQRQIYSYACVCAYAFIMCGTAFSRINGRNWFRFLRLSFRTSAICHRNKYVDSPNLRTINSIIMKNKTFFEFRSLCRWVYIQYCGHSANTQNYVNHIDGLLFVHFLVPFLAISKWFWDHFSLSAAKYGTEVLCSARCAQRSPAHTAAWTERRAGKSIQEFVVTNSSRRASKCIKIYR